MIAVAFGIDPCSLYSKQELMRPHLIQCFENSTVKPFPVVKMQERRKTVFFTVEIEIVCFCHLPAQGEMIECFKCGQLYHISCVKTCCMLFTAKETVVL